MKYKVGDRVRSIHPRELGKNLTGEITEVRTGIGDVWPYRVRYDRSGYDGLYAESELASIMSEKVPVGTRVRVSDRYDIRGQRGTEGTVTSKRATSYPDWVWVEVTKPASLDDYPGILHTYPALALDEIKEESKSEFAVGDRVRVNAPGWISHGYTGTVTSVNGERYGDRKWAPVEIDFDRTDHPGGLKGRKYKEENLELLPKPTFEVGDRVRVNGNLSTYAGVEGVITEVLTKTGNFRVIYTDVSKASNRYIKKGETGGFLLSWIELIDAKPLGVGDRVRVQKSACSHENGYTGRIVSAAPESSPDDWFVEIDGKTLFGGPLQLSFRASSLVRA